MADDRERGFNSATVSNARDARRGAVSWSRRELLGAVAATMAGSMAASMGAGCGPTATKSLRLSGSNTVYGFAKELAIAFRMQRSDVTFRITGDGTSRGIKFAGEGEVQGLPADFTNRNKFMAPEPAGGVRDTSNGEMVDIGLSSREIFQSEREAYSAMQVIPFAYDGIAVATNNNITVANLTIAQLRGIYGGMIRNWSEVGGPDAPIVVIARDTLAGTAEAWDELVMNGTPVMATQMISQAADVPAALTSMPNAIAYLSVGDLNPMTMHAVSVEGIAPTIELVASGRYPIKRPFVFVTGGPPTTVQKDFIDFAFSTAGQAVITRLLAVPATRGA